MLYDGEPLDLHEVQSSHTLTAPSTQTVSSKARLLPCVEWVEMFRGLRGCHCNHDMGCGCISFIDRSSPCPHGQKMWQYLDLGKGSERELVGPAEKSFSIAANVPFRSESPAM
eukprot:scaffold1702_cov391-Prasinococcus_capsulatus_cf.AAC.1